MGVSTKAVILIVLVIAVVWYMRSAKKEPPPQSNAAISPAVPTSSSSSSTPSVQRAIELGNNSMAPWGVNATFNGYFPDARWIWGSANANEKAPGAGVTYAFGTTFTVATAGTATVHIIVDNTATLILNGTTISSNIGGGWGAIPDYPKVKVSLMAGTNNLVINATNLSVAGEENPAGLLAGVIHDETGAILTQTNSSWSMRTVS
jgi:hypothetical protein